MIVVFYIDNLILTENKLDLIFILKRWLVDTFEMIDLGLQVLPLSYGIFISQSMYVLDLLKCLKMDDCKAYDTPFQSCVKLTNYYESLQVDATLYHQLVSSIIYLSHSRLDISFTVSVVSHFIARSYRKSLEGCKTYHSLSEGYFSLWYQIQLENMLVGWLH